MDEMIIVMVHAFWTVAILSMFADNWIALIINITLSVIGMRIQEYYRWNTRGEDSNA